MKLIIVSGTTSTGKTTLAIRLSQELNMSLFIRDDYKEARFDAVGKRPAIRELSAIDKDSVKELFKAVEFYIANDKSAIIETNFTKTQAKRISELIKPNASLIEIYCFANGFRVLGRYVKRYNNGERHRGHRDYLWYPIVAIEAFGLGRLRYRPLNLSPYTIKVNSNDFKNIKYEAILKYVKKIK